MPRGKICFADPCPFTSLLEIWTILAPIAYGNFDYPRLVHHEVSGLINKQFTDIGGYLVIRKNFSLLIHPLTIPGL